jgi:hypothetical protein
MSMADRPTCKTCRHWARETRDDAPYMEAECRAAAPVFVHGYRLAVWPTTEHTKWCAEYRERPGDADEAARRFFADLRARIEDE